MRSMLLKIARLPALGRLIGWCIAHLSRVLPLRIVTENERCIAFHHPSPSYDVHLLFMLKQQVRDVSCISAGQLDDVLSTATAAIERLGLSAPHIMLWTNGGRFQEVQQLHFHMFPSDLDREADIRKSRILSWDCTKICECVRGDGKTPNLLVLNSDSEAFSKIFPRIKEEYHLESRGYSVFWDLSPQAARHNRIYIRMG